MTTATAQAILLIALAVLVVDTLVLLALVFLWFSKGSPIGWQDMGGFHYGAPSEQAPAQFDGEGSRPYGDESK